MPRTVAIAQHSDLPVWLVRGQLALLKSRSSTGTGSSEATGDEGLSPRTEHRFARLVRFLETHFPAYLDGTHALQAGSAAVQELAKIHALSPDAALEIAPSCLGGEMTVGALRQRLADLYTKASEIQQSVRWTGSRRLSEFHNIAARRIQTEDLLPFSDRIREFSAAERRTPLAPDLVAREIGTGREIAIEIKAPRDTAARSTMHTAGELISRIAVLRLHYDDAILVMPLEAFALAEVTVDLWRTWVRFSRPQSCKIDILLVSREAHRLLSSHPERAVAQRRDRPR